ncbi:secA translation cis-regulator SecM [Serratia microhaemolytica]|uniref:secA translation cis-regulator SecM n=1 Tax=Serratia microhaemolytica TaxID=2675110 RepID=UPI000FDD3770|nr:secA translation cis-regulator SecM [Serratia microhaemolytica]
MIGILNRWRQFGRRYFWPHLLLGMVAATLGAPQSLASSDQSALSSTSSSLNSHTVTDNAIDHLALWQGCYRRPTNNIDYWQQHALRTVIRHLSFSLAPQAVSNGGQNALSNTEQRLQMAQLALISTLNALLTHHPKLAVTVSPRPLFRSEIGLSHHTGLWLAQVQGIRAGPSSL